MNNYLKIPIFLMFTLLFLPIIGYCQYEIVLPPNPQENSGFARSIAANTDFLFVGAPNFNNDIDTVNRGVVYIYRFDGQIWNHLGQLLPDSLIYSNSKKNGFGECLSLSDNYLAVSNPQLGLISIYKKDVLDWNKLQDIEMPFYEHKNFDLAIEITDSLMIVGNSTYENINESTGAVIVFENDQDNWTQEEVIHPPDDELVKTFGHKISFDGSKSILVGSRNWNEFKGGSFLYTFENNNWTLKNINRDDSDIEQGLVVELDNEKFAINGDNGEDTYIELYHKDGDDWNFETDFESDIPYVHTVAIYSVGDVVHFDNNRIFVTDGFGGRVNLFEESNGEYVYKESFPPNVNELPFYEFYLNGFRLASTDDFLFCGALGYLEDPYDYETDITGAVFVFPISKTNNTSDNFKNELFTLSPNPCSNQLNIISEEENRFSINSILEVNGKKLDFKPSGESIDVSPLKSGIYILKVLDNVSKTIKYAKFIKI